MDWLWLVLMLATTAQSVGDGAVSGRITAASGKLPEMIVYLESTDGRTFSPSSETIVVSQKGAKFGPPLVVICVGQTVDFINDEDKPIEHNVFSRSPAKPFDLGLYPPQTTGKTVTFDKPGVVRLLCSIHKYMDGVVVVCPSPFFTQVENGNFTIEDVPAGQWRLRTWQRGARFAEQDLEITVEPGKTIQANLEMKR